MPVAVCTLYVFEPPVGALGKRTVCVCFLSVSLSLYPTYFVCLSYTYTFFARCYGWSATSEYRFKIGDFAPTEAGWPKILGRKGRTRAPTILLLRKPYGIEKWTDLSPVLSQSTRLKDERTDKIFIARPRLHSMHRGKLNKMLSYRRETALQGAL